MIRQTTVFGSALVALASATLIVGCMTLRRIDAGLSDPPLVEALGRTIAREMTTVQTMTSSWVSGGITQSVSTPVRADETPADQAARHKAAVDALLALFPKDP